MKFLLLRVASAAAFVTFLFGVSYAAAQTCSNPVSGALSSAYTASGQISVSGNKLLKDGSPFIMHGLNLIALSNPPLNTNNNIVYNSAYSNLFPGTSPNTTINGTVLTAMQQWGVNTIRLLVSETALDPCNNLYSATLVSDVNATVTYARSIGLEVIISIQDELQPASTTTVNGTVTQNAASTATPDPDGQTMRVWQVLAPLFNQDHGVLYEIYNEPEDTNNAAGWSNWQSKMNAVVATVRSTVGPKGTASHNVIVADGLAFAQHLDGALTLTDSSSEIAYAIHPYFKNENSTELDTTYWQTVFGNWAASYPVVVTEWTTIYKPSSDYYCPTSGTAVAQAGYSLLQYISQKGIGLTPYAYDFGGLNFGSVVGGLASKNDQANSTWVNTVCGDNGYGPGLTLQSWYQSGTFPSSIK